MKQYVFEVLEEMAKQRSRDEKVRVLKENETKLTGEGAGSQKSKNGGF